MPLPFCLLHALCALFMRGSWSVLSWCSACPCLHPLVWLACHHIPQPCAVHVQVTQHGACLGLGLAGLGTNDGELFEELKNVLYTDSAIAGEAAGLGLGLLAVGSATDKAAELLAYAHDTQHEKVSNSLSLWKLFNAQASHDQVAAWLPL